MQAFPSIHLGHGTNIMFIYRVYMKKKYIEKVISTKEQLNDYIDSNYTYKYIKYKIENGNGEHVKETTT